MTARSLAVVILGILLVCTTRLVACGWAIGYFHQVTQVKGRVVGQSLGPVQFQWLRRMFSISGAELDIYEYRRTGWSDVRTPLAHVVADKSGAFQFDQLKEGHYSLRVRGGGLEDWFDVEINEQSSSHRSHHH